MIEFSIPPKPGQVSLIGSSLIDLLYTFNRTHERESLVVGAGFAIGSLLARECVTVDDANEITNELVEQAKDILEGHNRDFAPTYIDPVRFSSFLSLGIENGRVVAVDANL